MDYASMSPREVRALIREGKIYRPHCRHVRRLCTGQSGGLPKDLAYDFLLFAQRNPRPCPILEVSDAGSRHLHFMADDDADIAKDFPGYRIYENGILTGEYTDVSAFWRDDLVSFLIGCSFSFEAELLEAGIPVRHIEENCNVPMYNTNIACTPAGVFSGNMVVSMRPLPYNQVVRAVQVTSAMPRVHGAPIDIGDPSAIGIHDITRPDYGDMVTIHPGEVPVFWPCGVTPQNIIMNSRPPFVITHAPGHMFLTDVKNTLLKY